MAKFNPFKAEANDAKEHASLRDPLDVRELLTDATRKAVITPEGELQVQKAGAHKSQGVKLMKERYWGGAFQALFQEQLTLECRQMQASFPSLQLRRAQAPFVRHGWHIADSGQMFWYGPLTTYSGSRYLVAIAYPCDYPFGEIRAYVLEPFIPSTEHRFQDGHLCLYDHQGRGKGFEQGKSTAVTIVAWTCAWLHAYEIWRSNGTWPTLVEEQA